MSLASETCVPCREGAPRVTGDQATEFLADVPEWEIVEVDGVQRLRRAIKRKGWQPAVDLANDVSRLAEQADHHPKLTIEWGSLTVEWWTHKIGGLHRNDFIMAARVDAAIAERQPS